MFHIINYVARAFSKLMPKAVGKIRRGNVTVKQQLQNIGNKFILGISGQLAVYCYLGMPLSTSSNAGVLIITRASGLEKEV